MVSVLHKRWQLSEQATQMHPSQIVAQLLQKRDLELRPALHSPALFPDMERAVARIKQAIANQERVGLFGDYDCDGVTAIAQLVRLFERHGLTPHVRLPHRVHDGYGISEAMLHELKAQQYDLLITADTGITAAEQIAALQAAGTDVILTDHHELPEQLPPAYATIHPSLVPVMKDSLLSGSGVVYQLVRAVEEDRWHDMATDTALASFGTVADIMPLRGHNRALVQAGLLALAQLHGTPIGDLLEQAGVNAEAITSGDIGFRIAPRINAAGRLADPQLALTALLHGGTAVADLDQMNTKRQAMTEQYMHEALATLQLDPKQPQNVPSCICLRGEAYPHGVIGLIAGKLTEQFARPSVIATDDGTTCVCSLRSPAGYHIGDALRRHSDLLSGFGGHAQAAGCNVASDRFADFAQRMQDDVDAHCTLSDLQPTLAIDACLSPRDITLNLVEQLAHLEPYGNGNPEPLFLIQNIQLSDLRCVGTDGAHLQAKLGSTKAIGFRLGHAAELCTKPVDLVCRLQIDTWQGTRQPQVVIVDVGVRD